MKLLSGNCWLIRFLLPDWIHRNSHVTELKKCKFETILPKERVAGMQVWGVSDIDGVHEPFVRRIATLYCKIILPVTGIGFTILVKDKLWQFKEV